MASEFEQWVRQTVTQLPFFDPQKGGFIGTTALKKSLLATVPTHIVESTTAAKLAAELNAIFKQGGLTQELLVECERSRQHAAAERADMEGAEAEIGGSSDMEGNEVEKVASKVAGTATPGVGKIKDSSECTLNAKRSSRVPDSPEFEEAKRYYAVEPRPETKVETSPAIPDRTRTPTKKQEAYLESPLKSPSSISSKPPQSPTSPRAHDSTTLDPNSPTRLFHAPPFLDTVPQLPFIVQYRLLNHLQTILEGACYGFMEKEFPELLKEKEWTCPEAAELTVWVHAISKTLTSWSKAKDNDVAEMCSILRRAGKVRHCAVHRKAVSTIQLWIHLDCAEAALDVLHDGEKAKEVATLKGLIESQALELGSELENCNQQLANELKELERLREELTRRERAVRLMQEEQESRAKVNMAENLAVLLEQAINKKPSSTVASTPTRVGSESPTTSDSSERPTTAKKTQHTGSVEEMKKFGLKPLRPPPLSTGNLTKLAASARQASTAQRQANAAELQRMRDTIRSPGQDRASENGTTSDSHYWDASETLARKAVLEDDPGYSSEEGGAHLY